MTLATASGRILDRVVGSAAAILLLIAMTLMLLGVIFRYVLHHPQVWIDEVIATLFPWLTMLGAVLALRRNSHMRMTALVARTHARIRPALDTLTILAILCFMIFTLQPAFDFVANQAAVSMTTMNLSLAWPSAALPAGIALMLLAQLLKLPLRPSRGDLLCLAAAVLFVIALIMLSPVLRSFGNWNLVIFFVGVTTATVFAGIPIAFAFGLATLGYLTFSTYIPASILISRMQAGMSDPILLAVPLFVFLGLLIEMTGMAQVMVAFLANMFGHLRGGLSYVLVAAIYLVSGISGSKAADMAAIAPVLFPEMRKRGMPHGDLVALLAATGAQTETVPPSLILITIGSVTGLSIAGLFAGGILPALVGGFFLCAVIWLYSRRSTIPVLPRAPARATVRSFGVAIPALLLPFVIRSAIVNGVATATEVSTIGIVYAVIVGLLFYRCFDWRRIWPMLIETATLSGAILLIVGAATAMSWAITQTGISRGLAQWIMQIPGGQFSFLAISILIFIVLGSVLEGIPAVVLMGPLLFPVARQVGLNEIHYAMVAILGMGIGLFSPPFGVGYYVACAIGGCDPDEGLPYIGKYLIALSISLIVIAAVPWISTVLV